MCRNMFLTGMFAWMDGKKAGRKDGWMDAWMDGWTPKGGQFKKR